MSILSACPGGSMLNSAVSLGRAGVEVSLLTEFADDDVGKMILRFLDKNRVSTEYVSIHQGRKSPLALAFLNSENDARYSFYEDLPEKRNLKKIRDPGTEDIVMFGSILALSKGVRSELRELLDAAKKAGAAILYDPNFRPSSVRSPEETEQLVCENIGFADIVRASDEDMMNIKGTLNADDAYEYVRDKGCMSLIYTTGEEGIYLRTSALSKYYRTPDILTVSTVGAGDNFNAGIIYQFLRESLSPGKAENIPEPVWDQIIGRGIDFASETCKRNENYISEVFAGKI
ncbi:carbohydrate kinase family protein [Methanolobus halotolerans]|uniref:Carbohydrate kinase n=1 Tax=Methanolobus halotolerans TaxID=2052935 RepID=A0A4E0Q803_9EURY|nr:carbohydrate kinase [Methanolobus halotolerans]TGC11050.1 carbohydrate kinase [Methanolobus halotolerans]